MRPRGLLRRAWCAAIVLAGAGPVAAAGEAARVQALMREHGCVHCHTIDGVRGARGRAGPPLTDFGARRLIAGQHPNTLDNLTRFLLDPRALSPGSAMPRTVRDEADARAIAAFLQGRPPQAPAGRD
ncbi:c-type cytochrome [Azohydromonas aeria]|uniref:c-type cytochrome n=1 Tax=Azohydromonas aeria TaxID=2590212 RepID=UPI0012F70B92|nr:c-type cytochrome [Azohydromonas aeria]